MDAFYASVEQHDQSRAQGQARHRGRHGRSRRRSGGELRGAPFRRAFGDANERGAAPLPARHLHSPAHAPLQGGLEAGLRGIPRVHAAWSKACRSTRRSSTSRERQAVRRAVPRRSRTRSSDASRSDGPHRVGRSRQPTSCSPRSLPICASPTASSGFGPRKLPQSLDPLPIRPPDGVGKKTAARLEEHGIHTLGQLRLAPDSVLWPLFGRFTQRMRERASGIDERPVVSDWEEKSISAEETFEHDIRKHEQLYAELANLADRTCARMRASKLMAGPGAREDPTPRLHHVHAPDRLLAPHAGQSPHRRDRARPADDAGCRRSRAPRSACSASASRASARRNSSTCSQRTPPRPMRWARPSIAYTKSSATRRSPGPTTCERCDGSVPPREFLAGQRHVQRMRKLKFARLIGLALLVLAGCQAPPQRPVSTTGNLELELIVRRAAPVDADASSSPRDVLVWMMTSGGGAFVWPPKDVLIQTSVREGDTFSVSLNDIEAALKLAAKETTGVEPSYGVSYDPSAARVSRLSTFAKIPNEAGVDYFTSFQEKLSTRMLILIYVDRPCTIRAPERMVDGRPRLAIDAVLPHAGLHWLVVDNGSSGVEYLHATRPQGEVAYVLDGTRSR